MLPMALWCASTVSHEGKGKSSTSADGPWITVARKGKPKFEEGDEWKLRDCDWNAPVVAFDKVPNELQKLQQDGEFKAVILCNSDQIDTLTALLRGSNRVHAVLIIVPGKEEKAERCPGAYGHRVAFKMANFTRVCTSGLTAPGPAVVVKPLPKVAEVKTVVLYAKLHQRYCTKALWDAARSQPHKCLTAWMKKRSFNVQDSWGWIEEKAPGDPFCKLFGYVRVLDSEKVAVMAASGDEFFFDPSRDASVPPMQVDWQDQAEDEDSLTYLKRCSKMKPPYGILVGHRQLGLRKQRDASTAVVRQWILQGAPKAWTHDQVVKAVDGVLQFPCLLRQRHVRGGVDYFVRGAKVGDADMIAIPFVDEHGDTNTMVEVGSCQACSK